MRVSAYAIGASKEMNAMDMLKSMVVNIIQETMLQAHVIYCILSTTNMLSQHILLNASKIHQSFTNFLITLKATLA